MQKLLNQKPTHVDFYKKSCEPCINLIKDSFSHLKLKDNSFQIFDVVNDNKVDQIRAQINLDNDITGGETVGTLPDHPKMKAFLDHCTRQRTYFFSIKKCGKANCTTCLLPRLPSDVFDRLHHLPDPTPDPTNENHYKSFRNSYGTETTEALMPPCNITASKGHGIPFNLLVQHAKNTDLKITCTECNKPELFTSNYSQI